MKEEKKPVNTILIALLVVAAFVIGVLWQRNASLEKKTKTTAETSTSPTSAPNLNLLDVVNLKKYAQELSLNENDFNKCLDEGKYKDRVNKDINQAQALGISGTPAFLISGKKLGGAFPIEAFKEIIDKELKGQGSQNVANYSETLQQAAKQGAFDPKPKKVEISADDPTLGQDDTKVTIVEFSDFQCPYCIRVYSTVKQILSDYKDQIKFVFKQLPLVNMHPYAQKAAEASLCAKEQGKFFEYHDKLFEEGQKQLQ